MIASPLKFLTSVKHLMTIEDIKMYMSALNFTTSAPIKSLNCVKQIYIKVVHDFISINSRNICHNTPY